MDFSRATITELAARVAEHLHNQGIEVVLVGGLAVEIYSENLYLTKDIDMVNTSYQTPAQLRDAMAQLGFTKQGRVFANASTDITVEFPPAPLSVGNELIEHTTTAELPAGRIPILRAEDVVKDRLAAFIHWQDTQSLVQATAVLLKHSLAPETFKAFCEREGSNTHYQKLLHLYQCGKVHPQITMAQLEADLAKLLLNDL
ncbi:hypothetical protein [Microbulbifer sp.]|uniref:hypothetical protein n=1 Tax=Microbulbifer sp. TaxID=1908541 RepID=UPI003F402C43